MTGFNRVMDSGGDRLPTLMLVEDESLLRGLLTEFFTKCGLFRVVGSFEAAETALPAIRNQSPDLLLVDLNLGGMSGAALIELVLAERLSIPRVVVLSGSVSSLAVRRLLKSGVRGILPKGISAAELLGACVRVMRGAICIELSDESLLDLAVRSESRDTSYELTSRETEVLNLVVAGRRSKEIASLLGLSVRTVDKHRENLMRKLGVHDLAGLMRYAANIGLLHAKGITFSEGSGCGPS